MKNIVIISFTVLSILLSTNGFAKSGFSLGVFGSYSMDGGKTEDKINSIQSMNIDPGNDYKPVIIPGSSLFARYDFSSNLFIRTGFEFNQLAYPGEIKIYYYNTQTLIYYTSKTELHYTAMTFPLFFGISASPDKGRTNIYGAAGLLFSRVEIYSSTKEGMTSSESDNGGFIYGVGALFGIEKKIFQDFYLMIEYAFYKSEKNELETQRKFDGAMWNYNKYMEKYDLPSQQLRLGLRYAF